MTHLSADAGSQFAHCGRDRAADPEVPDEELLEALADEAVRAILAALETPKTARELTEETGLPSSTVYRKLDRLVDIGFLEESTRVSPDGKHASEYERGFEDFVLRVSEDGSLEVTLVHDDAADRLANLWSTVADQ